ncbi:MAG: cation transporter, partial [Bacteroidota bacterium]
MLSVTGMGALIVNMSCALILVRFRNHQSNLTKAAFLSARNDAFANIGIIVAGLLGFIWPSVWPDLIVGFLIMAMNLDAAKEIWEASNHSEVSPNP